MNRIVQPAPCRSTLGAETTGTGYVGGSANRMNNGPLARAAARPAVLCSSHALHAAKAWGGRVKHIVVGSLVFPAFGAHSFHGEPPGLLQKGVGVTKRNAFDTSLEDAPQRA